MPDPVISIAIPTYNEAHRIGNCLESIFRQDYPPESLEVIVIDDDSTDGTTAVAARYPVTILRNGAHDPEVGKLKAFGRAGGEFFYYLDADIEMVGTDWLTRMLHPLQAAPNIAGSVTRYCNPPDANALERYLNADPLQRDPVYAFFSADLESTVTGAGSGYLVCQYADDNIPPAGHCIHRRSLLEPLLSGESRFMELDLLARLTRSGHRVFAYVPEAGLYHRHAASLRQLARKRFRNARSVYLPNVSVREYRWFDLTKWEDRLKIFLWVLYVHLLAPAMIRGIGRALKNRDPALLYELPVTLLATDAVIWAFLSSSAGWRLIGRSLFRKDGNTGDRS